MNLETPKKFRGLVNQAQQVAAHYFRPISRKYDKAERQTQLAQPRRASAAPRLSRRWVTRRMTVACRTVLLL